MPAPAFAAAWLPSVPLGGAGAEPKVASDASGGVVAAWKGPGEIVQASIRPAGGAFSAPATLTPAGREAGSFDLDVNDAGTGVLAWTASTGGVPVVQFVEVSPGGFGPVQTVPGAGPDPGGVSVAVDGAGTATFAWTFSDPLDPQDPDDDRSRIRLGRRPAGGAVAVMGPLSGASEEATSPAVAVNSAGLATVAWTVDQLSSSGDPEGAAVRSVSWPSGGTLGSVETARAVTGDQASFGEARVAVDGQGATLVAWIAIEFGATTDREVLQTAVRPAQGGYGTPVDLSSAAENASAPALEVNEAGRAALAYSVVAVAGGTGSVRVAGRSAGGQFTGPGQVVATGAGREELVEPAAAINSAGTAFVAWTRRTTTASAVEAAVGPPSALGALTRLSPAGSRAQTPAVSADGEGNAFAAWDAAGPLGATAFDGAPPKLRGLAVPATAVAGEAAGFSVAPFDTWSAVTTTWAFGDGMGATGNVVAHAYGAPGSYAVGVTATDAAGNASADSRTVTVTPNATTPTPSRLGLNLTNVAGSRYCLTAGRRTKDLVIRFTLNDPATMTFRLQRRSKPSRKPPRRCPTRKGAPGKVASQFDDVQTATLPATPGESFVEVKELSGARGKASAAGSRRTAMRTMRLRAGPARARLAQLFGSGPLRPGRYRVLLQGRRGDDGSTSQAVSVKFLVLDERR